MIYSEFDALSFALGTLGNCVLTHFLQDLGIPYPDLVAAIICCCTYLLIR